MRIDFGLFEGGDLLGRGEVIVGLTKSETTLGLCRVAHQLVGDSAVLTMSDFPPHLGINTIMVDTPIHESADWETQDFGKYLLAFWCRLA
jgi:hypothetical protein